MPIMRSRYRRSVIVGRASYFSRFLLRGSWLLPLLHYVRHQLAVASVLVFSLCFIPFLIVWIAGVQAWRFVLHFVIKTRYPQLQLVDTRSLRCALDTHRWPGLAAALLVVDEQDPNFTQLPDTVARIVQDQVDKHPLLRRRLCVRLGCYLWREDVKTLDANEQISIWSKRANSDAQLQDIVGAISSKPLASDRPPWQVVLIPHGRGYSVLFRAHHLVVDSLAPAVERLSPTSCNLFANSTHPMLRNRCATSAVASKLASTVYQQWTTTHSSVFALPRTLLEFILTFPRALLEEIRRLAGDNAERTSYFREAAREMLEAVKLVFLVPHVIATQLTRPVENVPLLRASASPGYRVLAWTPPINKELVRKVAEAGNASEVHVLLAACAGALRHFLLTSGAPIVDSVSAVLPIVVGERRTAAFALIDLPTGEWDPIARLRIVRGQMNGVQKRPLHVLIGAVVLRYASCVLPQPVLTLALNFLSRRHTISVCVVDKPLDLIPRRSRWFFWRPPQGNAGLTFTLQSNEECVSLAIASNQSVLSNAAVLTSQFAREIHAMAVALQVRLDRSLISGASKSGRK